MSRLDDDLHGLLDGEQALQVTAAVGESLKRQGLAPLF